MRRPKTTLLWLSAISLALLVLALPASCAPPPRQQPRGKPVLKPVTKDPGTSLYTIPIRDGADLVIDTAGPLVWSTCAEDHLAAPFRCKDRECKLANAYHAPSCRGVVRGCKKDRCKAYPYNPVTGQCAAASLAHTKIVANATDGRNPVGQVSIRAVKACAPSKKLLASLPPHATGVAGLAGSGLALPAQIAANHNVANKFMLCLPRRGDGVAVFGGGPLFLLPQPGAGELTSTLAYTPLRSRKDNPMYYIDVKGIAMDYAQVALPGYALATGGTVLCTRVPYTLLRPDVYRPVVDAFAKALARDDARVPAVASFELCYRSSMLGNTRLGYAVPSVVLMLEGGKNWTVGGSNSMVDVDGKTACFAFLEMKGVKAGDGNAPAVLLGGFQMENNLVQFDLEKGQLGFAKLPFFTACSNFNFTRNQY